MNGNGKAVELLERIAAGQDQVVERLERLDHMVVFMGRHHANHERRLKALERRVFKKTG